MFKSLWHTLQEQCSGKRAYQALADISRHHRIQASPGFRQAAEYVYQQLTGAGVQAEILRYPANSNTTFWGEHSFQEWEVRSGTLHLVEPQDRARKLADFREVPISLIQRSVAFDGEVEIVPVDKGETPEEYEGLDLAGKLVLTRGNVRRVHDLAVVRRGAAGILFDGMTTVEPVRPDWALPDAIQYTSFWWSGHERKCFGFALSPRQGEWLRQLIQKRQDDGEGPIRARAHVDARLYDGAIEVVSAVIPAKDSPDEESEEIVLVAHLCHPQPSCNDNASGAAVALEVARSLQTLITTGALSQPRRTVRFLWVPEMTGTYAFLSDPANEDRIPRMIAGLNLDMVGQDQAKCASSFLLESPPDALPSFSPDLLARLQEMLFPEVKSHSGLGGYPLFRHAASPFNGGSDHYIFSDPTVGVPMPMIIQWPDKYYHTSADTLDKVDPAMLGRTCVLAAAYSYWLAQAGESEARWMASEMSARFRQRSIKMIQEAVTGALGEEKGPDREGVRRQLEYRLARYGKALASLTRIAPLDTRPWQARDEAFAKAEFERIAGELNHRPDETETDKDVARLIPRRLVRGPVSIHGYVARLEQPERDEWWELGQRIGREASHTVPVLAQYWADGTRTIGEIGRQIALETGLEATQLVKEYFCFVERLGVIELTETNSP